MVQALKAAVSPERPLEINRVGKKKYCLKFRIIYNIKNTSKSIIHHETAL